MDKITCVYIPEAWRMLPADGRAKGSKYKSKKMTIDIDWYKDISLAACSKTSDLVWGKFYTRNHGSDLQIQVFPIRFSLQLIPGTIRPSGITTRWAPQL